MSVITDTVRRLDAQLDRIQLQLFDAVSINDTRLADSSERASSRLAAMRDVLRALSVTSNSQPLLHASKLIDLLSKFQADEEHFDTANVADVAFETDLLWLIAAKAAINSLGLVMRSFVDQTIDLNNEIWYWDETIASFWSTCFYALQTTPVRLWSGMKEVVNERRSYAHARHLKFSVSTTWKQFYEIILRKSDWQLAQSPIARILTPFEICKNEVLQKRNVLQAAKYIRSSSIGFLIEESLCFDGWEDSATGSPYGFQKDEWRRDIARSVILIEAILQRATKETHTHQFEEKIFMTLETESDGFPIQADESVGIQQAQLVLSRLHRLLQEHLPDHNQMTKTLISQYGRPPWLVRYWLPLSVAVLSTSSFINIVTKRRAELVKSLVDFGYTGIDFWANWVVEPIRKLIGTIRHDEKSEIAIMSKNSLEADRASLERMVVDFIVDRSTPDHDLSAANADLIRQKVKDGDLTPVLRAYERDLRQPFIGTLKGDLVRALLIQVQKTKVDVEIAMSGIDALLKSQELVFGFVGLTPGLLVSFAGIRWLWNLSHNRRGLRAGVQRDDLRRALRSVDRTLTTSTPTANGLLSFKDHGLLVCETEILLNKARNILTQIQYRDFREDIGELLDVKRGIEMQSRVLQRIVWAHSRQMWL